MLNGKLSGSKDQSWASLVQSHPRLGWCDISTTYLQDTFLRSCEECVARVVDGDLHNGICGRHDEGELKGSAEISDLFPIHWLRIHSYSTVFGEGKLEHRGDEEGQRAFGVVDLSAALAQPPGLSLVGNLIQAAVFPCHEDSAQVGGADGQNVGVVCGDGKERVREQLHPTTHAVTQTCNKRTGTLIYKFQCRTFLQRFAGKQIKRHLLAWFLGKLSPRITTSTEVARTKR